MQERPGDVRAEQAGTVRVVTVFGEHDVSTLARLRAALAEAATGADGVVADLADCDFRDSMCVGALFHASQVAPGGRFGVVVKPGLSAEQILDLMAFREVAPTYATREAALTGVLETPPRQG